ncbi:MAG: hypothetical protein WCO99_08175, partial [Planctomycetota bacterium]
MQDGASATGGHTIDAVLSAASDETRAALRTLGELVGNEPATVLSPTQFAVRHLGVDQLDLASTKFTGPGTSLAVLGNLLRLEMERYGSRVVVGSPGDGLPPTWSQLDVGPDEKVAVPGRLVAFFPAGTLAAEPLCVAIDDRHWQREFAILSSQLAKDVAEKTLEAFRARLKTRENPLRGRVLEACVNDGCVRISV